MGKVKLIKNGAYKPMDACLMCVKATFECLAH